ncbi:MAG TPA: metal ABC transporter permease [Terriglobia bacterium]|nr:metal ABC transporter permease [Terriglobia bacterium]
MGHTDSTALIHGDTRNLLPGGHLSPPHDSTELQQAEEVFQKLSLGGFLLGTAAVILVVAFLFGMKDRLILDLFSPELAAATGVNVARLDLGFLLVFSLTVLVGLRFMGALLSSALIIIPAATARQLTGRMAQFVVLASAMSLISVSAGFLISTLIFKTSTVGPTIVIVSVLLFVMSLLKKK